MDEHIFFWMLTAQIIKICNVEMKIWGFTPSSGAFSKWLSRRKCRKTTNGNFCISTSDYHRYTQFISRYMFLRMTNMVISMKSTNMPVSILPKTKRFKVLCVFIANYGVNNDKIRDIWPPWGFKDVDHVKKQKAKINHFRKTAFLYHRFILFNSK